MEAEASEALAAIGEAMDEAHHFWHEAADAYHDPERFRPSLNALVQALRNVTFRVQAYKDDIPGFDKWYVPWRSVLAADPVMRWVNEARVQVTKRRGLTAHSRARLRLIWSYLAPGSIPEHDVDPALPTEALVESALRSVPEEMRHNSLVEVTREWQFDELPDREVLAATRHAQLVLGALVDDLSGHLTSQPTSLPGLAVLRLVAPPCMSEIDLVTTVRINPESRLSYRRKEIRVDRDESVLGEAQARYLLETSTIDFASMADGDLLSQATAYMQLAQRILSRDGYHIPMLMLRRPDGSWELQSPMFEDKLEKFIMWHSVADEVRAQGYDAFIFIGETWTSPPGLSVEEAAAFESFADVPGRGEALCVDAESGSGESIHLVSVLERNGDEITLSDAFSGSAMRVGGYAEPIRQAWRDIGLRKPDTPTA